MSFNLVRGDLDPMPITLTSGGVAVDVSTATSVDLRWEKPDGTTSTITPTAVNAVLGQFRVDWVAGDSDVIGTHYGQVIVTTAGVPTTYPNDGSKLVWFVNPQLGDC